MWRVTYAGVLRGNICVDGTMSGVQTILFYILGSTLPGQAQFTLSKIIFFFFLFFLALLIHIVSGYFKSLELHLSILSQ